ncbi:outer membrane beta-barrel protein [Coxiella burnetii]|uniref:outer membrane beta-barrel protein n=1 Tax=Coxiella burnetii TaxID=777 RepID=UPI00051F19CF|nr:outer membrane beta-barrel protein [Coxiella burnetii]AIT63180.1 OmpA-like transmembrane domain protein [Coxiella burnetii str. Namibia]
MKNIVLALIATVAVGLSTESLAQGAAVEEESGLYTNGDLVGVKPKVTNLGSIDDGGIIYKAGGGYQFNKYFALEGNYTRFPNLKSGRVIPEKSNTEIYAAGKAIIPLKKGYNVFAKIGAAQVSITTVPGMEDVSGINLSNTHSEILPYGGLGVGYSVSQKVGFNLQFAGTPEGDNIPARYAVMGGLSCNF